MHLSEGVEWALHCCTLLGALPDGVSLPAGKLAEYHGVPAAYLSKQLAALANAGIVDSTTGRYGGYRLARRPGDITLLDVVEAIEGDSRLYQCTEIRQRGPAAAASAAYTSPCAIARAMGRADEAWRRELSNQTIADIATEVVARAPQEALARTGAWLLSVSGTGRATPAPAK